MDKEKYFTLIWITFFILEVSKDIIEYKTKFFEYRYSK